MQLRSQSSSTTQMVASKHEAPSSADASRKRAKFNLFGPRAAEDLSGPNDLKRFLFERRSGTKPFAPSGAPSAFLSPRLSVVGRPSSKATSVLGIGIEAGEDASRSFWRHRKLSRSSSRNSVASSIASAQSTAEPAPQPMSIQPVSTPATAPSTPRPKSRHGRGSRPNTRHTAENPPPISPPRNFVHITHTGPEHFAKINTATENDLLTEFSAVRAAQSPRRTLLGIKVGALSSRNSTRNSARNSAVIDTAPSMTTGSTRSSYYNSTKPPTTPVTPTSHHRSLRSKSSFSLPFRDDDGGRRTPSRASMSSRNGAVATPVEDLPPLPPSNFTSARVSVCLDDYEDIPQQREWCHAVTTDAGDNESIRSEGIALTTDEPVPSPGSAAFPASVHLPAPAHQHGRAHSPARSDKSARSTASTATASRPRVSIVEPPKSALKHELASPKSDSSLRNRMKRSSLHGGLFSSWHADSDSDDEPLDTITEDPQDQEDIGPVQQETRSLEPAVDESAKRDSSPLPLVIPNDSPPTEQLIEAPSELEKTLVTEIEIEPSSSAEETLRPDLAPEVVQDPLLDVVQDPLLDEEVESDAESDITAIAYEQPAVLDAVAVESQSARRVTTTPEDVMPARRSLQPNADKRATVVIGALDNGEKATREDAEEQSGRRSVPLRKNSGKTVRFKEDLVSFIREEVARRNQPTPEQSAGQVQASLEDLEATLARLEAEIAAGPERNGKTNAPKIAGPEVDEPSRPIDQPLKPKRAERSPIPRASIPKGKRPLSESYDKHPNSLRGRGRRLERVSPSRPAPRPRRASYDDVHDFDPTSPGDDKFFDTKESQE